MSITIRLATSTDAELIADMSRETFYDAFATFNTKENMDKFLNKTFTKEALMKEVGAPNNIFLLAYVDNEPAGYVRLRIANIPPELGNADAIEIARIYAVHNFIGKGVGKALMEYSIRLAKERNKELIWLGVWEHNQRAIDFYRKQGFKKFSEHEFILGDDVQTDWLMKKKL